MEHHYTNVPIKFLDRPYCLYIREIVTFRKTQLYTCIVESPKSAYGVCVSMLGDGMESNMYNYIHMYSTTSCESVSVMHDMSHYIIHRSHMVVDETGPLVRITHTLSLCIPKWSGLVGVLVHSALADCLSIPSCLPSCVWNHYYYNYSSV